MEKEHHKSSKVFIFIIGVVVVFFAGSAVLLAKLMTSDDGSSKRTKTHVVNLIKPPPPPSPVKEKPPEPEPPKEVKQREEIVAPGLQQDRPQDNRNQDDKPAGKHLGIDAEGGAGSDGFGLVGNRGGAALIGGGGGGGGLLRKYAGYTRMLEDEINRKVRKLYEEKWGTPKDKQQVVVKITMDARGAVTEVRIITPSRDSRMDGAVKEALAGMHLSQPPPEGMPKGLSIRLSSKG